MIEQLHSWFPPRLLQMSMLKTLGNQQQVLAALEQELQKEKTDALLLQKALREMEELLTTFD